MIIGNIHENWNKGCYIASFKETVADCKVSKMQKTIVSMKEYANVFKEGDKAFLEGTEPINETEDTYGSGVNYKIISVRPQNTVILIYFEKI